jgi:hypothetical protein
MKEQLSHRSIFRDIPKEGYIDLKVYLSQQFFTYKL